MARVSAGQEGAGDERATVAIAAVRRRMVLVVFICGGTTKVTDRCKVLVGSWKFRSMPQYMYVNLGFMIPVQRKVHI